MRAKAEGGFGVEDEVAEAIEKDFAVAIAAFDAAGDEVVRALG